MKAPIDIHTADGIATATIFRPDTHVDTLGRGVILYMDAFGPRAVLDDMAQTIADAGHLVLVPDLFYRFGDYGPLPTTAFSDPVLREKIMTMMAATTQELTAQDSGAFITAITNAGATGKLGVVGYCMGGGRALTAAARYPDRIAAAASFHGGNLASDAEDSPHRLAADIKARVYIGVAGVDNSFPPQQSARLAEAFRIAEVDHTIENYVGMAHGWAVPDHSVYDEKGGERHWKRLFTLFEETL